MKVKWSSEVKGPIEVNFKRGGGQKRGGRKGSGEAIDAGAH